MPDKPILYVGIGASAGGLEAIEQFFINMPADTGMAFIVIQHLSPDYKSLMVEILSKKTDMKVLRAENEMEVLPNHIYLISPKNNLKIYHGKILLVEPDYSKIVNLPIDVFLRSLAQDQGEKSVAIILSGTGSDGMRGLRAVKESGGFVLAQTEDSAQFSGMPKAASSTGMVDFSLKPSEMPEQLIQYTQHPYVVQTNPIKSIISNKEGLPRIFALLREHSKVDFSHYKPSTIHRRIERRMSLNGIQTLQEYAVFLQAYPSEISALFRDLLIGVTSFFRDHKAFEFLSDRYLPELLNKKENEFDEIRFWVAGCSTGEEAYSLAILAQETLHQLDIKRTIKIFATDIDQDAIQFASAGLYPESIVADLPQEYLSKYFVKKQDSFMVNRSIREMVVFAKHNLIKDPPFTKIDLISCRNLLIYLQPALQQQVIQFFNFSLKTKGFLFLGSSETLGDMARYFEVENTKYKIYRSRGIGNRIESDTKLNSITDTRFRAIRDSQAILKKTYQALNPDKILEKFTETITPDILPLTIIVDEQMAVVHTIGDTDGFFRLPSGKKTNDITRMAVKDLSIPLSNGLQKVFRQEKALTLSNITIKNFKPAKVIDLKIIPINNKNGYFNMAAVLLIEKNIEASHLDEKMSSYDLSEASEQRIYDLEQELQLSRENLQATIEELETSNEELQAANEELLASNEELQSTNEELQSTNEELHTVNGEYQKKLIELTELENDVNNLLINPDIGKIILDENLEVRRFSENIAPVFKILENDVGRPLTHVPHFFKDLNLIDKIKEVQKTHIAIAEEITVESGQKFLMRISPYEIASHVFSGTILSFADITDFKQIEKEQIALQDKYRRLFETMTQGVVYQDNQGRIISVNPAALEILGLSEDEIMGRTSMHPEWRAMREDGSPLEGENHPAMIALKTGETIKDAVMGVYSSKFKSYKWIKVNAIPHFKTGEKKPYMVYATFDDITNAKNAELNTQKNEQRYRKIIENMMDGFLLNEIICNEEGKPVDFMLIDMNKHFEQIINKNREELLGKKASEIFTDLNGSWIENLGNVALGGNDIQLADIPGIPGKNYKIKAYNPEKNVFALLFQSTTNREEQKDE